jgi:hypothetical protein
MIQVLLVKHAAENSYLDLSNSNMCNPAIRVENLNIMAFHILLTGSAFDSKHCRNSYLDEESKPYFLC